MFKIDVVVVGAGIVGLAIARALAERGREVVVLERESGIGQVTSSRNSEVIHAGLYYAPGSLKARLCVEGRHLLYRYCAERGVPYRRCGKLVVATSHEQDFAIKALFERATANGVEDLEIVAGPRLRDMEPELHASTALLSPGTGIVDSHALMLSFQGDAENAGTTVQCRTPVLGGVFRSSSVRLRASTGDEETEIETGLLVNAAGLGAWEVSQRLDGLDPATIPPRHLAKGSYFAVSGRAPFEHLIYPVPTDGGLGIHLTFDLAGQARFGPDVEWVKTVNYEVDPAQARTFYTAIRRYWPDLPDQALAPAYAGVRPRLAGPGETPADFLIQGPEETRHPSYVALYGIDSPGLTASLAIADYVAGLSRT